MPRKQIPKAEQAARLAPPGSASQEFSCRRAMYGCGCGRFGRLTLDDPDQAGVGLSSPPLERMLGGLIGEGGRVRVSVEVIEPGRLEENPWKPPVGESWAEWEGYCSRQRAVIHTFGGFTTVDRIRAIAPQDWKAGPLGIRGSLGYGGCWIALADVTRVVIEPGDESSAELLAAHGVAVERRDGLAEAVRADG